MGRRRTWDKETFRSQMARVCPADAEQDAEMQRLLDRMNGQKSKRELDQKTGDDR